MRLLSRIWSTLIGGEDTETAPLPHADSADIRERVRVFVSSHHGEETLGFLEQHGGQFIFSYADEYRDRFGAIPISAFPDLRHRYESKDLWPFFAVRLPPAKRADVRELIEAKRLTSESVLRHLAELSPRTISNPYRFELAAAAS